MAQDETQIEEKIKMEIVKEDRCIECSFKKLAVASYFLSNGMVCIKTDDEGNYIRIDTTRERVQMMNIMDDKYRIQGDISPVNINPTFIRQSTVDEGEEDVDAEDTPQGSAKPPASAI